MIAGRNQDTAGIARFSEGEVVIKADDVLQILRRRIWVILLSICVCTGVALGVSLLQTPQYQTSIKVLVGQAQGIAEDPSQATNLQLITVTLGQAVATYPVAQAVVRDLNLDVAPRNLIANMDVAVIPQTQFIEISYTDTDPRRAQRIANAIGSEFEKQISGVSPKVSGITATVWEPALVPQAPISPKPARNTLIGVALGGMLGVGLAFLLDYLDDSWQSPEEAERISGVPTIGVIPKFDAPKARSGKP